MNSVCKWFLAGSAVLTAAAAAALDIQVVQSVPCNIFETGSKVVLPVKVTDKNSLDGKIKFTAADFSGKVFFEKEETLNGGKAQEFRFDFGALDRGYYELTSSYTPPSGEAAKPQMNSFAVADFSNRTAKEARDGGYRFGMKLWLSGDIWWNRRLKWDHDKIMAVSCRLGLQWTRAQLGHKDTLPLIQRNPINMVVKVESYPPEMIDKARYPKITDFTKVKGGVKALLPKKAEYQAMLRAQLAEIPADQYVFEIWNEPWQWNTMPAEDFALLAEWASEVIAKERPGAVIGSNIHGSVTSYDRRVINAGKFRHQNMVAIHPYCTRTPEYRGFRQGLWNYQDFVKAKTGKKIELYSTEFGWSTSPEGKNSTTEGNQARFVVRESFELYAADVKTLIPHTMASREQNPKEREDYFGFYRLNSEPKPALIAFAVAGRMIDASKFIGEQNFGPGIGAMRFERGGVQTLALWTEDKEIPLTVNAGVPEVTVVDIMGVERKIKTEQGKLALKLSGSPLYLVGVAPAPAGQLSAPDADPMVDRWRPRSVVASLPKSASLPSKADPAAYGKPLIALADSKASASSLQSYWSWTPDEVAVLFDVKDKAIVIQSPDGKKHGDRLEFDLCLRPGRQSDKMGIYDYRFRFDPAAGGKPAQLSVDNPAFDKDQEIKPGANASGISWSYAATPQGYRIELRVKTSALGVKNLVAGQTVSYRYILYNRDRTDVDEWKKYNTRVTSMSDKACYNELQLIRLTEESK